jgi:sugar lactone lactonase YvrE
MLTISLLLEEIHSQNLLNIPESIIFNSTHCRYLISNYSSGDIVQVDSTGHQTYLVQQQGTNFQGLEIAGNVVYVGANQYIRGYDLENGQMVMNIQVPNVTNLNDVTADTSGNLYVSDVFGTKIIKVRISAQTYSVFVNGQGIDHPNGLLYDPSHNRVLVCSFRTNSPIQSINLADSTVTTLTNTTLSFCDGITMDRYGRYYVTSWTTIAIYRFDSVFSSPPYLFYQNSCGPADISYDRVHGVIAVPLQQCNTWAVTPVVIGIKKIQE